MYILLFPYLVFYVCLCGQRPGELQAARAGYSDWIRQILRWGVFGLCREPAPKARALRTAVAARGLGGPSLPVGGARLALGRLPLPPGRLPAEAEPRIQSHRKGQPGRGRRRRRRPRCAPLSKGHAGLCCCSGSSTLSRGRDPARAPRQEHDALQLVQGIQLAVNAGKRFSFHTREL